MTREKILEALGQVLAGLQVPYSIGGPALLGAAAEPWAALKAELVTFGWANTEDFTVALKEALL